MSFFGKLFGPSKAELVARTPRPVAKRRYEAAKSNRLLADWIASATSSDADLRQDMVQLRARARDLAQNNVYARKFLKMVETNVVGERGVRLQMRVREAAKKNGEKGRIDQAANDLIEEAWRKWCRAGNCTVDGRLSWVDAQRLVARSVPRDGEIFVRKIVARGYMHGFAIQFIDPDHLDAEFNGRHTNGNEVRMGVEIDRGGRPVAYHFWERHPNDYQFGVGTPRNERIRVPATDILHLYEPDRVDQTRGVPWMATAMLEAKMLGGYKEAEVVAARTAAAKMGFFLPPEEGGDYSGDDKDELGNTITEAAPGTFETLPTGFKFESFDPQHPTTAYKDFVKGVLKGIASGLNVSYVSLASDLEGVTYSSIRQGALDERDHWRVIQCWLIEHFHVPIFEAWLLNALSAPAADNGINLPADKFDKFNQPLFIPRGWQWVDPQKETDATLTAIDGGLTTLTKALAEKGDDLEEVLRERASEKELAESLGVELGSPKPKASAQPPAAPEDTGQAAEEE